MRRLAAAIACALIAAVPSAAAAAAPDCLYDVRVEDAEARSLSVAVRCDAIAVRAFRLTDGTAARFVADARAETGEAIPLVEGEWRLPGAGASLRYRVDLDALARAENEYDSVLRVGGSVLAGPAQWMVQPVGSRDLVLGIRLSSAAGGDAAIGLPLVEGSHRIVSGSLRHAGPAVFGRFGKQRFSLPGLGSSTDAIAALKAEAQEAAIDLVMLDAPLAVTPAQVAGWVRDTGLAIAEFWHGFPVEAALVIVLPVRRAAAVPYGRVLSEGGVTVLVLVGEQAKARVLYDEWVLVHEFVHLGSPYIRDTGAWLNEGFATYLEPIIRARAGWRTVESVWREWLLDMPRGFNAIGRDGLRRASGGGVYWGGAIFMLLADIEMRRQSGGAVGLEDCLRAVLREGGDVRASWTTEAMLARCDTAVGGTVMQDLAARHLRPGSPVDLDSVWRELGVTLRNDQSIGFDDTAPLAAIRDAILSGGPDETPKPIPIDIP